MIGSWRLPVLVLVLLGGCAVQDSRIAHRAQHRLVGLSELELEACLGVPDQHSSFPGTDVLTYAATSSSSTSYSVPIVGGLGLSNGGYCHATFRVDAGVVTNVLYSGEKNATLAPDAYCAPIVRTCLAYLAEHPPAAVAAGSTAVTREAPDAKAGVAPEGTSAAPQPGASTAGFAGTMPTPTPK